MKHPLQVRIIEARNELSTIFDRFKGNIPSDVEKAIESHLHKLDVISEELKETNSNDCPTWLTKEVRSEVSNLWNHTNDNQRFPKRVDAAKLVIRIGAEAGFKVTL